MIVVDQNIPNGFEAFSSAGTVIQKPGRDLTREDVREATALIVRSITKVNRQLLEGTPVRFVGTCTIGTDHLDIPWLESQGITWKAAPGCNARSVAEYVLAALCRAHLARRIALDQSPICGIVGVGRVGKQVQVLLEQLGLPILRNDPPRSLVEGPSGFVELDALLAHSQIVCAHLPLTREGEHATHGLLSWEHLQLLPLGAVFLNAGRGPTSPSEGLRRLRATRPDITLLLDVWDPEPLVPQDLISEVLVGTPHIAGYSHEGKLEGTRMIRAELGQFLSLPEWVVPPQESVPFETTAHLRGHTSPTDMFAHLVLEAYDLQGDHQRFSELAKLPDSTRGQAFDQLRKAYPVRREYRYRPVTNFGSLPDAVQQMALKIGLRAA